MSVLQQQTLNNFSTKQVSLKESTYVKKNTQVSDKQEIQPFQTPLGTGIISREELLMKGLMQFFSHSYNLNQLIPVLEGTSPISLRVLDWFVTNYSKQYDVAYNIKKGDQIRQFVVHNHYKAQLKGYSKQQFDPFCRRKRIDLQFGKNKEIETTVGQLNFFKWAIENKVLDYVHNQLKTIIDDMNLRGSKAKKGNKGKHIKKELSISATKSVTKHNVTVTVKFD